MSVEVRSLLRVLARFLVLALVVGMGIGCVLLDVLVLDDAINEISVTEIVQETLLPITALIFWRLAKRPGYFGFGVLIGGFFGCMFIRELDALFDLVVHGLWKLPAYALAILCCVLAWRDRRATLARMVEFTATPSFGLMAGGLVVILVFSRFFGIPQLWEHMLSGGYARVAKNAVEEGTEMLGYCICFCAAIDYVRGLGRADSRSTSP